MPVASVMRAHSARSFSKPSQLAEVPLQQITSTCASANSRAASRILLSSNWFSEASRIEISVTVKREKCAETPGTALTIALVSGSSAGLEDGVSKPTRFRCVMVFDGGCGDRPRMNRGASELGRVRRIDRCAPPSLAVRRKLDFARQGRLAGGGRPCARLLVPRGQHEDPY